MSFRVLRNPLFLSLVLHALCIVIMAVLLYREAADRLSKPSQKTLWVELEKSKVPDNKPNLNRKRIVQTKPGEKVDTPAPDAFLAWQNQNVDRQTVSKNKTTEMGTASHASKSASSNSNHRAHSANRATQENRANRANRANSATRITNLSKLGIPVLPRGGKTNDPSSDTPEWATPGMRPQDFVEGMKESDQTALNTKEFKFYGYYQRIRERLDQAWIPILREKLLAYYQSGRKLADDMDHATKVLVVLNDQGSIIRVQLVNESGIRDLDDAAIGAFNRAGPFPNPPRGIIDANREIQVPWDFILKT